LLLWATVLSSECNTDRLGGLLQKHLKAVTKDYRKTELGGKRQQFKAERGIKLKRKSSQLPLAEASSFQL